MTAYVTDLMNEVKAKNPAEPEFHQAVQEVAARAIRRLDILEGVMIAGGAVLALVGGALIAALLSGIAGLAFRTTWIVASLVLFVVPGAATIVMIRRDARPAAGGSTNEASNER